MEESKIDKLRDRYKSERADRERGLLFPYPVQRRACAVSDQSLIRRLHDVMKSHHNNNNKKKQTNKNKKYITILPFHRWNTHRSYGGQRLSVPRPLNILDIPYKVLRQ